MDPGNQTDESALHELADEVLGKDAWHGSALSPTLSSVDVMRFLVRIERRFGITVPDDELRSENFASPDAVLQMIQRHRVREQ